ncbi:MAG: sugar phosphate isomerase/epimerase [Caldilineaceae bacterium]|nr:sugar phosphate isomerase/epimerase [Caldilineaceae bacterium]
MLAEMMDRDLPASVSRLAELNIRHLDLKTSVFGRAIEDLDNQHREELAALIAVSGSSVYCFSSTLGHRNVCTVDERTFRAEMEAGIANMIATAQTVRPAKVRLLSCWLGEHRHEPDQLAMVEQHVPWVIAAYRDAIDQIAEAGLAPTIENEPHTILASPEGTIAFFERLERPSVTYTWDVQNMWQSGSYPSLEAYYTLRPIMDYFHLKGGRSTDGARGPLAFRCPLAHASWPVREILDAVLADGASPVICLNPSHGAVLENYAFGSLDDRAAMMRTEALHDVDYLRANFGAIA